MFLLYYLVISKVLLTFAASKKYLYMKKMCLFIAAVLISMCSFAQTDLVYKPVNECYVTEGSYYGDITVPEQVDLNGSTYLVTAIGDYAFRGCSGVTSVNMTNRIKKIGQYGFAGTSILSITIPASCREIGTYAFNNDVLQNIEVDANNDFFCIVNTGLFDKALTTLYQFPADCSQDIFEIPEGVKKLNSGSLIKFRAHTIDFPSTIESMGQYNYIYCPNLTSMIVRAVNAPTVLDNNDGSFRANCTLYVPAESIEEYKASDWWGGFKEIKTLDEYTAVENVKADAAAVSSVYNVNGTKLAEPTKGLNIIKYASGDTKKVVK